MKELLDLYYKHVESSFKPGSYSRDMYELLFLSQLNSYALQFNPVIVGPNNVKHPMSLISLVLSGSGSGKDSAIKFLDPLKERVESMCNKIFNAKRDKIIEADGCASGETPDGMNFEIKKMTDRKKPLGETLATEHVPWVKSATEAGMNMYFATYSSIGFGSIGLSSTEFGQDFKEKSFRDTLEKVLELWDSPSKVASRITNEKGAVIFEGIQSGCVMHGAFDEFKKNDRMIEDLQTYLSTSMARRGLFARVSDEDNLAYFKFKVEANKKRRDELRKEKLTKEQRSEMISESKGSKYMDKIIEMVFDNVLSVHGYRFINFNKLNSNGNLERPEIEIRLSRGAEIMLHIYQTGMEEEVLAIIESGKISDKRLRIEYQSRHLKAMRIAGMSAFYDKRSVINEDDVKYACSFVQRSGAHFAEISKPSIVVDDVCEYLVKTIEKLTVRNLEEAEVIPTGMTKARLADLWERCAEELYQKNMIFRSTMGKSNMIQQIWIERLVETKDDEAHISYSTNESQADVYMQTKTTPIHDILNIEGIKKMGAGGFKNNARSINNIQALGNVLIYDIDDGELSIEQCRNIFAGMCGFMYATKSHLVAKPFNTGNKTPDGAAIVENRICERFRIVLLCKQHFPFGEDKSQANEEYKLLYAEIAKHFGIPFDENAMDSSRFYWIPENANPGIFMNIDNKTRGTNKIDLTHFMPNLKIHNEIMAKSKVFDSKKYWENMSVRDILERCLKDSIIKGGRNSALFSMAMSLKDKHIPYKEIKEHIFDVNDKFDAGSLDEAEISRTILSTLQLRIESDKDKD